MREPRGESGIHRHLRNHRSPTLSSATPLARFPVPARRPHWNRWARFRPLIGLFDLLVFNGQLTAVHLETFASRCTSTGARGHSFDQTRRMPSRKRLPSPESPTEQRPKNSLEPARPRGRPRKGYRRDGSLKSTAALKKRSTECLPKSARHHYKFIQSYMNWYVHLV